MSVKPLRNLSFDHPYTLTKLMFSPPSRLPTGDDLLASSGDFLRPWEINEDSLSAEPLSVLSNSKTSEFSAPLTSFDWNDVEPKRMRFTCKVTTGLAVSEAAFELESTEICTGMPSL
ncbi:unnamed protein product [Eruca vesicaria subsp. sativa]|uniref:Uncharacterized protein n=1 Tax=Eruca vesicaria subsp. sativa TaxID=29727 RepID=A0ABC8L798_ERUVS|nr:unnamed protein product [Eruca vesicaria subsp. sativa]